MKAYSIYNHPHSCDVHIEKNGKVQTLSTRMGTGGGNVPLVLIQEKTGTLSSGAHPGSYNGQDAYNDMLVVDDGLERRKRTNESGEPIEEGRCAECDARSTDDFEGGADGI